MVNYRRPLALFWAGFRENDRSFEALLDLNAASGKVAFLDAMKKMSGFAAAFTFTTVSPNIINA